MVAFTERDSLLIFSFLKSYKHSSDHSHVNEGRAKQILPYVLRANPKQKLIAHMPQRSVSRPNILNVLVAEYASNETIIQTQDEIKNLQQLPIQRASDFAYYIRSRTSLCGSTYGPINQIDIFIKSIAHQIREQTTR